MKWYLKPYINRRNWLLDNAENLGLSSDELLLCLMFDFLNEQRIMINYEIMEAKLGYPRAKLDTLIQNMVTKGLLEIYVGEDGVTYDILKVFEQFDEQQLDVQNDIFKAFEDSFGRPLSPNELQKLADFTKQYPEEKIIDALRSADAYRKVNIAYIEKILKNSHES